MLLLGWSKPFPELSTTFHQIRIHLDLLLCYEFNLLDIIAHIVCLFMSHCCLQARYELALFGEELRVFFDTLDVAVEDTLFTGEELFVSGVEVLHGWLAGGGRWLLLPRRTLLLPFLEHGWRW